MPNRFSGVGAWLARSHSAVFLRSRDRGSEDAVVFSGIGGDGYFEHTRRQGSKICFGAGLPVHAVPACRFSLSGFLSVTKLVARPRTTDPRSGVFFELTNRI